MSHIHYIHNISSYYCSHYNFVYYLFAITVKGSSEYILLDPMYILFSNISKDQLWSDLVFVTLLDNN